MLEAFIDFKRVYVAEGKKYGAFLRKAIGGHRCIAVDRDNVAASVSHLVAEYARYASFLYIRRKFVIYHFTKMDSLDLATAEQILSRNERRHELTPAPTTKSPTSYPSSKVYERFAMLAQRYGIFVHPISATTLMDFRDGKLSSPLVTSNVSRIVFFLKMMELNGLIGHIQWKRFEEPDVLVKGNGQRINPGYMRRIASKLYPKLRLRAVSTGKTNTGRHDLYDKMTYDVLCIMCDTEGENN